MSLDGTQESVGKLIKVRTIIAADTRRDVDLWQQIMSWSGFGRQNDAGQRN
jgi:hypothetical protein